MDWWGGFDAIAGWQLVWAVVAELSYWFGPLVSLCGGWRMVVDAGWE